MIEGFINKTPQQLIELLEIAEDNERPAIADSIATVWLTDYFSNQSPFQIKNLIRNLAKAPSPVLPFLLYTVQQIGNEFIPAKEEEIRYEKMRGKENIKTKKELEIMLSLVDVAKEILRKLGLDFKAPPPIPKTVESVIKETDEPIWEQEKPSKLQKPEIKTTPTKPKPPAQSTEEDDDEDFEIQKTKPAIPIALTQPAIRPTEQLHTVDENFSPAISNIYSGLKKLPKDKLLKLENLSGDIPYLYELLTLPKNAEIALKIAKLISNKTLKEIFDFVCLVYMEQEIDNKFLGLIVSSLIQSNYIPIMELDEIEIELEQISTSLRNNPQLLNIYYNLWLINKKLFPITTLALKQARLRHDIFNVGILLEELEKEKMLILILEEFLSFKIGIKIKTDPFYKREIEQVNLNLILHFAAQNSYNSLLIAIYHAYGHLNPAGSTEDKKYKLEDTIPLGTQIGLYKPGNIAKELATALAGYCKKDTPPEKLSLILSKLLPKYINTVDAMPTSNYSSVVRECIQAVLKYAVANNWDIENTIFNLALCLFSFSKYASVPQLGYIGYQITQELVLGTQNLKYKINDNITGLAKVLGTLQNEPPVDKIKRFLEIPKAYEHIRKNMVLSIFDTFIDIYESITLAQNTAKTFNTAIMEEKEKFSAEKQKYRLKEALVIY